MNIWNIQLSRPAWALPMVGASLGSMSALAADEPAIGDAQARYQQERSVCLSGQSNQDRATCLIEARNASAEAKKGALDEASHDYQHNARQRCDRLPAEDRRACDARMQGRGTTSGSAAAGGIYRELVTRDVDALDAVQPESGAAPAPIR